MGDGNGLVVPFVPSVLCLCFLYSEAVVKEKEVIVGIELGRRVSYGSFGRYCVAELVFQGDR